MTSLPIDLHLELSTLRDFINGQIHLGNPYSFDGKELYEILKRVVIDSELKPFLTFPKDQNEQPYYDNYQKRSNEQFDKLIPDFFEYEGEFYDLERIQYVFKEFTRPRDFEKLFLIKLLELKANECPIGEFLYFQQFDNFYGQKESIDSFLYQLTANDGNCRLLQELCQVLRNWIGSQSLEVLTQTYLERNNPDEEESAIQEVDSQEKWDNQIQSLRGKELKSDWTIKEILHYFSFLYKEKSEYGEPYLKKEQVEKMFENGFRIPLKPIDPLYIPNCSKRYPIKNITFAINLLYTDAKIEFKHKKSCFLFFGSFIEGYSRYLISPEKYRNFSSNTSNSLASRTKINWDQYLPSGKKIVKPSI